MIKSLIVCACIIATGVADAQVSVSPLSLALSAGSWLLKDNKKAYYVTVEATADSKELALQEAFRLAIDMAVGTFVVTQTEVNKDVLIRKEFVKYSAGFIQDFQIKSESKFGKKTKLVVDVWVTESKLAEVVMTVSKAEGKFDGKKSAAIVDNNIQRLKSSDKLFDMVLNDFPSRAFFVMTRDINVSLTGRDVVVNIPTHIEWHPRYMNALSEVFEKTRQGTEPNTYEKHEWESVIRYKKPNEIFMSVASYRDKQKLDAIIIRMIDDGPILKVDIKDSNNKTIVYNCFNYTYFNGYFNAEPLMSGYYKRDSQGFLEGQFFSFGGVNAHNKRYEQADFSIYGDFKHDIVLSVKLPNKNLLENMSSAEVSVVPKSECHERKL